MDITINNTHSNFARVTVGLLYFTFPIFLTILYVMILAVIIRDKSQHKFSFFRIMISISIADLGQLIFNGLGSGIFTLFNWKPEWLNKFFGAMLDTFWFVYGVNVHLLAINRFVNVVYGVKKSQVVFGRLHTTVYVSITWLYGIVWFGFLMSPRLSLLYSMDYFCWTYDETDLSKLAGKIDMYSDIFHLMAIIGWYTVTYVYLKRKVLQGGPIKKGTPTFSNNFWSFYSFISKLHQKISNLMGFRMKKLSLIYNKYL